MQGPLDVSVEDNQHTADVPAAGVVGVWWGSGVGVWWGSGCGGGRGGVGVGVGWGSGGGGGCPGHPPLTDWEASTRILHTQ